MTKVHFELFRSEGFAIIKNAISPKSIQRIESDIESIFNTFCQANDASEIAEADANLPLRFAMLEKHSQKLFYDFSLLVGDLESLNNPAVSREFADFIHKVFESFNVPFSSTHAGLFFNIKNVKRLQYNWHQERSYFKNHELGVHFWGPLFNDIQTTGGPMLIKTKSHTNHINFKEIAAEGALTQMQTDSNEIAKMKTVECNINRGDIVVFDHKCVHCTKEVDSEDLPRVAFIRRFAAKADGSMLPTTSTLTTKEHALKS